ncbi:MAG TPA: hypothetical protein VKE91_08290 [Blastocatellia bacterium]|nr:hypothetical protein [Blastocatellia bacterium]
MASFRVRTPAEYLRLLWRRRYFILTPFMIAGAALCWAVHGLPNIYESTTMIIVVPPRVSSNYVQPVSPKRRLLYPLSLIIGLLTGLIAAIAIESRAMMTIRDSKDVAHYARLPLLVTVPKIVTPEERRMRPLVNTAKVFGVLLLIAAAVPLRYQAIKASRLLNVLTGG